MCPEGRISTIFVDNHSVFDLSDPALSPRFSWAYRLANRLHPATREGVVRRELLFAEGECYDVERLRASERLLRSLEFIAGVDIFGVRQADSTIHVIVDTQDEWSLRADVDVGGDGESGITGFRIGEENLLGTGTQLSAFWVDRREVRVHGGSFYTPQLLGTRWDAQLDVGRTRTGHLVNQAIYYPFVGEVGKWAMRQAIQRNDRYFEYLMPQGGELVRVWFPERRSSFDVGAAFRFGAEGDNRTVLGAALAGEWVSYPAGIPPRYADSDPEIPAPAPPEVWRDSVSSVRAMFMVGQRSVYYQRHRGLDTVNGTEDLRFGVETELAVGPSVPGLASGRDFAFDVAFAAAAPLPDLGVAGGQVLLEARRDYRAPPTMSEWRDVFGQLNLWAYLRESASARHVLVAAVSAAGGWHDAVPFQLTLGERTGLRGYPDHIYAGGRRLVATLEQRSYLGWPLPELFDLGAVAFADVGRIWAGDAPFGMDSPWRANVGLGIRAAFPPGSRRTLRVDVGVPVGREFAFRNAVLSVGTGQVVGLRRMSRDSQLRRSTRQGVSSALFATQ